MNSLFHLVDNYNFLTTDFILLGLFPCQSKYPFLLCMVIFVVFLMTLFGNTILILLVYSQAHLRTPMYFFISQLSLMDVMHVSVTVSKMLMDQVMGVNKISALECGMQMFLYLSLVGSEYFLLAAMAYDPYVAIFHPLHYPILMNHKVCLLLMSGCWFLGSVDGFMLTPVTMTFPFSRSWEIHHFFCEVPALMKLSCSDTSLYEMLMYLCCVLMLLIPVIVISSSYTFILLTIHRMNSAEGWNKALNTCSSHMMDMVVSVFYTIITPVLNPLIYSIRNKVVTGALKKMLSVGSEIYNENI
uniref:G-protein coupled receptors family 1 profile domain-containing protein n=1 Tax=Equus caballus TaxID=9796 RepID=A0A3Q2H7T9_HORSE